MKDPPLPAEICKRRGSTLTPIITKCFDETTTSEDSPQVTQIQMLISPDTGQGEGHVEPDSSYEEISRWSSTTEDSNSNYSKSEPESELDYEESYEDKVERYRQFFDYRPLKCCLDGGEDQLLSDLLLDRLLREVQQPGLPFEESIREGRGDVQIRHFWNDVRKQLELDENFLEEEWREGHPQNPGDGLHRYLSGRVWRKPAVSPREREADKISQSAGSDRGKYTVTTIQ